MGQRPSSAGGGGGGGGGDGDVPAAVIVGGAAREGGRVVLPGFDEGVRERLAGAVEYVSGDAHAVGIGDGSLGPGEAEGEVGADGLAGCLAGGRWLVAHQWVSSSGVA